MRNIRLQMNYSIRDFAELLGVPFGSYCNYESGRRPTPPHVFKAAQEAQRREAQFFKSLQKRVDKALGGKGVPNEAHPGAW